MPRFSALVIAVSLVLVAPSGARALDMCFNTSIVGTQTIIVAKRYSRPSKGSCKPIHGFEGGSGNLPRIVSGAACLNAAGDTLRVAYTVHPISVGLASQETLWGQIDLDYPSLASGRATEQSQSQPGSIRASSGAIGGPCFVPAPLP